MSVPSILDTAKFRHLVLDGANSIASAVSQLQGFQIPEYDEIAENDFQNWVKIINLD